MPGGMSKQRHLANRYRRQNWQETKCSDPDGRVGTSHGAHSMKLGYQE